MLNRCLPARCGLAWLAPVLILALALVVAVAGCGPGGESAPTRVKAEAGAATATEPRRPAFISYEATGRRVLVDALGKETEVPFKVRFWASARALRSQELPDGPAEILRLDRKVIWRLDPAGQTFRQATFGECAEEVDGIRRLLSGQLGTPNLPEGQRRSLEVALGRRQPKITVKADEETVELLGRRCRHLSYYEDDCLRIEEWVTDELALPCDLGEVRALFGDFSRELLRQMAARRGMGLRTRVFGRLPNRPRLEERELTLLEIPDRLDPGLFEIPPGYSRDTGAAATR
jgi:hypothetical protein